ncbi:MAG: hypothetical protein PVJ67_06850 [Candidatus Pacearchaeota archaeon]|jgi:hypothetical protein
MKYDAFQRDTNDYLRYELDWPYFLRKRDFRKPGSPYTEKEWKELQEIFTPPKEPEQPTRKAK